MYSINLYKARGLIYFSTILLFGVNSNKITVAFTEVGSLKKGSSVYAGETPIGKVVNYKPNNNLDTVFIVLGLNRRTKIPKDSQFYIDENLLGDSKIVVEYSINKSYLSKKDIAVGEFRTIKRQ